MGNRTEDAKALVVAWVAGGHTRNVAAESAGIAPRTLDNWLRDDAEFRGNVERAEAAGKLAIMPAIVAASEEIPDARIDLRVEISGRLRRMGCVCQRITELTFYMPWYAVPDWITTEATTFHSGGNDETERDLLKKRRLASVRAGSRGPAFDVEVSADSGLADAAMILAAMEQHLAKVATDLAA